MSQLLKSVLKLGKSSSVEEWESIEGQVLGKLKEITCKEFAEISGHFGKNQQGSQKLWGSFEETTLRLYNQFTVNQMTGLFSAFGESKYDISKNLNRKFMETLLFLTQEFVRRQKELNPYVESNIVNFFKSVAPSSLQLDLAKHFNGEPDSLLQTTPQSRAILQFKDDFKKDPVAFQDDFTDKEKDIARQFTEQFGDAPQDFPVKISDVIRFK